MPALQATLDDINTKFEASVPASIVETMHRATVELVNSDLPGAAVREGDELPEFTLNDSAGNPVSSSQLLDKGPLIVSFFRGFW
ncbi:MAG: hypothetical protein AAGC68_05815 [Verrucomicrobiota bacterium]